jgi:hypothetical protein
MRPQVSAEEYIRETKLIEKRLEFLRAHPTPIPVNLVDPKTLTDREIAARFYGYVVDTGLRFAPYQFYLNASQRQLIPEVAKIRSQRTTQCLVNDLRPLIAPHSH